MRHEAVNRIKRPQKDVDILRLELQMCIKIRYALQNSWHEIATLPFILSRFSWLLCLLLYVEVPFFSRPIRSQPLFVAHVPGGQNQSCCAILANALFIEAIRFPICPHGISAVALDDVSIFSVL